MVLSSFTLREDQMRNRRLSFFSLLISILFSILGGSRLGGQEISQQEAAQTVFEAFSTRDTAGIDTLHKSHQLSAYRVADTLFEMYFKAKSDPASEPSKFLEAATWYAETRKLSKWTDGLPATVRAWKQLDETALAKEQQLRITFQEIRTFESSGKLHQALNLIQEADEKISSAVWSVTAARILYFRAQALMKANQKVAGADAYHNAGEFAKKLGWLRLASYSFYQSANEYQKLSMWKNAKGAWEMTVAISEDVGNRVAVANYRVQIASCYSRLGKFDKADELFTSALTEQQELKDEAGLPYTYTNLGDHRFKQNQIDAANRFSKEAVRRSEEQNNRLTLTDSLLNLGLAYMQRGEFTLSKKLLERALETAKEVKYARSQALIIGNLGTLYSQLGDYQTAFDLYSQSRADNLALQNRARAATMLGNMATVYYLQGHYAKAINTYENAIEEIRALDYPAGLGSCLIGMGKVYANLEKYDLALEYFDRALKQLKSFPNEREEAICLANTGAVYALQQDYSEAMTYYQSALAFHEKQEDQAGIAHVKQDIGNIYLDQGDFGNAEKYYRNSLEGYEAIGARAGAAYVIGNLGALHAEMGEHEEAIKMFEKAMKHFNACGSRLGTAYMLGRTGTSYFELGEVAQALSFLRKALSEFSYLTEGLGEEEKLMHKKAVKEYADAGARIALHLIGDEDSKHEDIAAEVFWFMESIRATLLQEGLVNRSALAQAKLPLELQNEYANLIQREAAAREGLRQISSLSAALLDLDEQEYDERLLTKKLEYEEAYRDRRSIIARMQREQRSTADLLFPEPVDHENLQQALEVGTTYLAYHIAGPELIALMVESDSMEVFQLGPWQPVAEKVSKYTDRLLSDPHSNHKMELDLAADLYEHFIRPLEEQILNKNRLVISPAPKLTELPFEALIRTESSNSKQRVVERWEVAYVPSASVFTTLLEEKHRQALGTQYLAFGDATYASTKSNSEAIALEAGYNKLRRPTDWPRLEASGKEVRRVGELFSESERKIFSREEASVSQLKSSLKDLEGRLAILHLAGHGVFWDEVPYRTGLVLANNELLTLDDVHHLQVPADLVIVSACASGKGKPMPGEGSLNLVRAFFLAGAHRVLASNWPVLDDQTVDFVVTFSRKVRQENIPVARALQETKLERIRNEGKLVHPYYWAPFVLWGLPE